MTEREAKRLSSEVIDSQNAMWFAWQHARDLRYSSSRGRWFVRDEGRWTTCSESKLRGRAFQTVRYVASAARSADYERRESLRQMASRLKLPDGLNRVAALASFIRVIQTDLFIETEFLEL